VQADGNLVLLNDQLGLSLMSHPQSNQGALLRIQDDGNLVIYSFGGDPIRETHAGADPTGRPKALGTFH
jgi:hypothetical protein